MNKNKLKGKMAEFGDTMKTLAEYLGIHRASLSAKVNSYRGAEFNQTEIKMIAEKYKLNEYEICEIFFEEKAS